MSKSKVFFLHMLEALGYVHIQHLVHRDIKPYNFMINPKGQIKLMDFAIANITDTSSAQYT
jgi:serine/threonine protein kinase